MELNNVFYRDIDRNTFLNFVINIKDKLNFKNLFIVSKKHIKNLIDIKHEKEFLAYRFWLLRNWINQNEVYTKDYIKQLEYLINKLYLANQLNAYEIEYIKHFESIVFAKNRNLKQLIVDFYTENKEKIYYHYENVNFHQVINNNRKVHFANANFYISNYRILIVYKLDMFSIKLKDIKNYHLTNDGIIIELDNHTFFIDTYDFYVLYVSIERILRLNKIRV